MNLSLCFDDAVAKDKVYECVELAEELALLAQKGNSEARKFLVEKKEIIQSVKDDLKLLTGLLKEIREDDSWTLASQKKGVSVHFKQPEGSPFVMTKTMYNIKPKPGSSLTDTFVAFSSLIAETDLMPKWFPRGLLKSHQTLCEVSSFSRCTQIKIELPFIVPKSIMGPREAVIHGKGYDMTSRSALAVSFKSLQVGDTFGDIVVEEPEKGWTRIDIEGAYFLEMQPDGSVNFHQLQQLDLKVKMIPPFIMNAIAKGAVPFEMVNNLMKRLHQYDGSEWETRVRENPELYEDIRDRLEAYLSSRGLTTSTVAIKDEEEPEPSWKDKVLDVLRIVVGDERAEYIIHSLFGDPPTIQSEKRQSIKPPQETVEVVIRKKSMFRRISARIIKKKSN